MTTQRTRARVSRVTVLAASLALAGCATTTSHLARDGASSLAGPSIAMGVEESAPEAPASTIRFDNQASEFVRVYLVGEKQQWLLGRVERGANASLKIPAAALAATTGWMRLTVVPDQHTPARPAAGARAATMAAEPVTVILSQRWTFSSSLDGGQLSALPLERAVVPK